MPSIANRGCRTSGVTAPAGNAVVNMGAWHESLGESKGPGTIPQGYWLPVGGGWEGTQEVGGSTADPLPNCRSIFLIHMVGLTPRVLLVSRRLRSRATQSIQLLAPSSPDVFAFRPCPLRWFIFLSGATSPPLRQRQTTPRRTLFRQRTLALG